MCSLSWRKKRQTRRRGNARVSRRAALWHDRRARAAARFALATVLPVLPAAAREERLARKRARPFFIPVMLTRSTSRVFTLAANTFIEAARQRFFAFLILLAAALAAGGSLLRTFNFGNSELKFTADFGFGGMFFFGSILAVVMMAQLFFSELDNRTALTLLARPVRRGEFFLGKFLGVWALLGVFVALTGGVLLVMLLTRSWELSADALAEAAATRTAPQLPVFSAGGLALGCLLQWLRLGTAAALTLLVCSFARSFLYTVVVATMAVLACQLQGLAREAFAKTSGPAWSRITAELGRLIPDLQLFDLGAPLALQPESVPAGAALSALGYGALYPLVIVPIAVWIFADREL
jgi:ABC-type transport system involved in multi-copper enzyme maturation permease subunit